MVYLFLADGFETVEALACVDILRRAEIDVKTVGINGLNITSSQRIKVSCDTTDREISISDGVDGIILPGGMPGTLNLEASDTVQSFLDYAETNKLLIAAICAAPSVLGKKGLLKGKKATCFPGFEEFLQGADYTGNPVERDGNIITARGMGVANDFALEIVSFLKSRELAEKIDKSIQSVRNG